MLTSAELAKLHSEVATRIETTALLIEQDKKRIEEYKQLIQNNHPHQQGLQDNLKSHEESLKKNEKLLNELIKSSDADSKIENEKDELRNREIKEIGEKNYHLKHLFDHFTECSWNQYNADNNDEMALALSYQESLRTKWAVDSLNKPITGIKRLIFDLFDPNKWLERAITRMIVVLAGNDLCVSEMAHLWKTQATEQYRSNLRIHVGKFVEEPWVCAPTLPNKDKYPCLHAIAESHLPISPAETTANQIASMAGLGMLMLYAYKKCKKKPVQQENEVHQERLRHQ